MHDNINMVTELSYGTNGMIAVVMSFIYTVIYKNIHNLGKRKLQKTKPLIFPKSLSTRLLEPQCFIEIATGLKNFKEVG